MMLNSQTIPADSSLAVQHYPLGEDVKYLDALVAQFPGLIKFETGAGHIIFDLLSRLPSIDNLDREKAELCNRITGAVYPLAAQLYARAVTLTITVSSEPIFPPSGVNDLATYVVFDAQEKSCRSCFLSPHVAVPDIQRMLVPAGIAVLCEPFYYQYHQLKDDFEIHPRHAESNLPSKVNRRRDPEIKYENWPEEAPYHYPETTKLGHPLEPQVEQNYLSQTGIKTITPRVAGPHGAYNLATISYVMEPLAQKYWRHKLETEHLQINSPKPPPFLKPEIVPANNSPHPTHKPSSQLHHGFFPEPSPFSEV